MGKEKNEKEKTREGEVRETKKTEEEEKFGEEHIGGEGGGTGRIIPNKGLSNPAKNIKSLTDHPYTFLF